MSGTNVGSGTNGSEEYAWAFNGAIDWNGGGLHFSNDYGFGLVDATAAVRLAETWLLERTAKTGANDTSEFEDILNATNTLTGNNVANNYTATPTSNLNIEHVEVDINFLTWDDLGDLDITLTSPNGTVSKLIDNTGENDGTSAGGFGADRWEFHTNAFWGEQATGSWTLTLRDQDSNTASPIVINDIDVTFYGSASGTFDTRNYVFTDEFSDYDGLFGHGTNFTSSGGPGDVLNASAVTSNTTMNFQTNTGTIDGVAVTFGNALEYVWTGDGSDSVFTDTGVDGVYTGRGDDLVDVNKAFASGDTYDGGDGRDAINWLGSNEVGATFDMNAMTASDGITTVDMRNFEDLVATNNSDTIIADSFVTNTIEAGGGNDLIRKTDGTGSSFSDSYDGGTGVDTLETTGGLGSNHVVDLTLGMILISGLQRDLISNIENVTINSAADIVGNNGANVLTANGNFNNTIDGNGGGDSIFAGGGNDLVIINGANTVNLGTGNDTAVFELGPESVDGGAGTDLIDSSAFNWASSVVWDLGAGQRIVNAFTGTWANFEDYINTNAFNSSEGVIGTSGSNFISISGTGRNSVHASFGSDTVYTGGGNDTIRDAEGASTVDTYDGGAGIDLLLADANWVNTVVYGPAAGRTAVQRRHLRQVFQHRKSRDWRQRPPDRFERRQRAPRDQRHQLSRQLDRRQCRQRHHLWRRWRRRDRRRQRQRPDLWRHGRRHDRRRRRHGRRLWRGRQRCALWRYGQFDRQQLGRGLWRRR